ncbi:MAG: hypothetical protein M3R36_11425 [Bacteroidota bacterium]|nr:hypothetical protein [Bacteroidota bacterium]
MTKKEKIEKNIDLAFGFIKKVIDNPTVLDKIVSKYNIKIIQEDNPSSIVRKKSKRNRVYSR